MTRTFESEFALGTAYSPTSEQAEAARRTVAVNAVDVDDARQLLDMLGLIPGPNQSQSWVPDGHCSSCDCPCVNNPAHEEIPHGFRRFARNGILCTVCHRGTGVMRA